MAAVLDAVLGPVIRPSTYRRWVFLILGGAVLVPFMLIAGMVLPSLMPAAFQDETVLVVGLALVLVVGVMLLMSLIPAVRVIEGTAARELLGDGVPEQGARRAAARGRRRPAGARPLQPHPRDQGQAEGGGGHGLSGMRDRVTVLRGQMTAGREQGRWLVRVRIPLRTVRE